jgi:hypothetical protein
LRVVRQTPSKGTQVANYVFDISADEKVAKGRAGQRLYIVAPSDGKDKPVTA